MVAEQGQLYRFCSDLGKLALQLAYKFGNTIDKGYVVVTLNVLQTHFPSARTVELKHYTLPWHLDTLPSTSAPQFSAAKLLFPSQGRQATASTRVSPNVSRSRIVCSVQTIVSHGRELVTLDLQSAPVSDLLTMAEEVVADIRVWTVNSDTNALAMGQN